MTRCLFLLFLIGNMHMVHGQSFQKIVYGVEEGLLTHLTKTAAYDSIGFLWVGTDEGLMRYDGKRFTAYPGVTQSRFIKKIVIDEDGKLLVVSDLGIVKINPRLDTATFEVVRNGVRTLTDTLLYYPKNVYVASDDVHWVSEPGSIVRMYKGDFKRYQFPDSDVSTSFFSSFLVFELKKELYAISYNGNLYQYDRKLDQFRPVPLSSTLTEVNTLLVTDTVAWLGDSQGLHKLRIGDTGFQVEKIAEIDLSKVSAITGFKDDLIIGDYGENLVRFNPESRQLSVLPSVFRSNGMLVSAGGFWVCSDEGVVMFKENFFDKVTDHQHYVESIAIASKSVYHSYKEGIFKVKATPSGYHQSTVLEMPGAYFLSITGDEDTLWVSNKNVLFRFHNDDLMERIKPSDKELYIFHLFLDTHNRLWISQGGQRGVSVLVPSGEIIRFEQMPQLQERVMLTYEDDKGRILCGASGENSYLYAFDEDKQQFVNLSSPLPFVPSSGFDVNDLVVRNDTIWLATSEGLLRHVKGEVERIALGKFTHLSTRSVALEGNYLWVSSTHGVLRIALADAGSMISFNETSGLASRSGNARVLRVDKAGTKWVGSAKGLSYAEVGNDEFHNTGQPLFAAFHVNDKPLLFEKAELRVPYGSYLQLDFLSLTYPGHSLDYQVNTDGKWRDNEQLNTLRMTNVKTGHYEIRVRARQNGNYLWSEPASIRFYVDRPFYYQWWFILIIIGVIAVLIYIFYRVNSYRMDKLQERLNTLVEQRTTELKIANKELMQANKELDMFVYSASHDLKAPLASMVGLMNLYKLESDPMVRDDLIRRMRKSVVTLDAFIRDIIDYSKNSRLDVEYTHIDLGQMIADVLDSYQYMENYDQVDIQVQVENGQGYCSDKNRLRIILNNLISNAIRYCDKSKQSYIKITAIASSHNLRLSVADNGKGIAQEHLGRIFEMFYRADMDKVGSGLGLYIVKESILTLNGTIDVSSTLGEGSTFKIVLPNHC